MGKKLIVNAVFDNTSVKKITQITKIKTIVILEKSVKNSKLLEIQLAKPLSIIDLANAKPPPNNKINPQGICLISSQQRSSVFLLLDGMIKSKKAAEMAMPASVSSDNI